MRSIPSLWSRFLKVRVARFGLGGILNSAITYLVFLGLLELAPYQAAYTLAFSLGIALSYLINTTMVFNVESRWKSFVYYAALYVVQYLLGLALVTSLVELADIRPAVASLLALVVLVPTNYLWIRHLLTRQTRRANLSSRA